MAEHETEFVRSIVVKPPWSWAIRPGGKNVENRGPYALHWKYRGLLYIQAGRGWSPKGQTDRRVRALADSPGLDYGAERALLTGPRLTHPPATFTPGCVVAVANLTGIHTDCYESSLCSDWADDLYNGEWATHLTLSDVYVLPTPIASPIGHLGLFHPLRTTVYDVQTQLIDADWPGLVYKEQTP